MPAVRIPKYLGLSDNYKTTGALQQVSKSVMVKMKFSISFSIRVDGWVIWGSFWLMTKLGHVFLSI